jgi:hypothetical protein
MINTILVNKIKKAVAFRAYLLELKKQGSFWKRILSTYKNTAG